MADIMLIFNGCFRQFIDSLNIYFVLMHIVFLNLQLNDDHVLVVSQRPAMEIMNRLNTINGFKIIGYLININIIRVVSMMILMHSLKRPTVAMITIIEKRKAIIGSMTFHSGLNLRMIDAMITPQE